MIDVNAVALGQSGNLEKDNVLSVELGAPRKVIRTSDDGLIDDEHLVVHEIVAARRRVWGGILADKPGAFDDLPYGRNFPVIRGHCLPLLEYLFHLCAIEDSIELHSFFAEQMLQRGDE